jgi:hypothetical protein
MEITTVGLDIAKRVFQLHGVDAAGRQYCGGSYNGRKCGCNALLPQSTAGAVAVHLFAKVSPATIEILICLGFSTYRRG